MDISLRKGIKQDLPQVLALIKELADYENALDQVSVTLEQLEKDGFEGHPHYYLLVAEYDNQIIGVCFYFIRYSTWKGKVLFLEDFVVKEEFRNVNGMKVLLLHMNGTIQGIKFSYYGYYYSNSNGTVQFITYTSQNLLDGFKSKIEDLLNGIVELI